MKIYSLFFHDFLRKSLSQNGREIYEHYHYHVLLNNESYQKDAILFMCSIYVHYLCIAKVEGGKGLRPSLQ